MTIDRSVGCQETSRARRYCEYGEMASSTARGIGGTPSTVTFGGTGSMGSCATTAARLETSNDASTTPERDSTLQLTENEGESSIKCKPRRALRRQTLVAGRRRGARIVSGQVRATFRRAE